MPLQPSQPDTLVPFLPSVAVTGTTEIIRDVLRVRANASYTSALHAAAARPYILPLLDPASADDMLDGIDGLLLTGGEDIDPRAYGESAHAKLGDVHAVRDAFELALVRAAFARKIPTLAICRGIQVANVALGGTLVQDIPSQRPDALDHDGAGRRDERVHPVRVTPASRLASALGADELRVNSFHHQAVSQLAPGLVTVATAPDGIVEGVEWQGDGWWMVGVQWHPEELTATPEPWDRALFAAFVTRLSGAKIG